MSSDESHSSLYRFWDAGQRHLAAGRYVAARGALERAEAEAWRRRDARTVARIYLPLLEARRQIRYQAVEGQLVIGGGGVSAFLRQPAGTWVVGGGSLRRALKAAAQVGYAQRRTGHWLEALVLVQRGGEVRIVSAADPAFAGGLTVRWTTDPQAALASSTERHLVLPLPPPGTYRNGPLHALARESLLVAWEGLALRWQHRHALGQGKGDEGPWGELAWLRRALAVDPACEPIAMRLMALAESVERHGKALRQG